MTQETAKERIYREALDEINNLAIDVAMDFEETGIDSVDCGKIMDIANKAFFAETNQQPSDTDKLSVEKLQEIRVEELKDFNSKILQAELENQKLQKEIDAAKKYIEESYKADKEDNKLLDLIIEAVAKLKSDNKTLKKYIEHVIGTIKHDGHLGTIQTDWILPDLKKALAAIGGDDEL
ncbi:hypothetical protein [Lactococcus lactis]|uniref:hypothetical protein n=1 Tax=Lactococcus lactis TaxID=1358 RepID=UPI0032AEEE67